MKSFSICLARPNSVHSNSPRALRAEWDQLSRVLTQSRKAAKKGTGFVEPFPARNLGLLFLLRVLTRIHLGRSAKATRLFGRTSFAFHRDDLDRFQRGGPAGLEFADDFLDHGLNRFG